MASSCNREWRAGAGRLRQRWERLREERGEGRGDVAVLLKASAAVQRLDAAGEEMEGADPSSWLRLYTQAILDVSYYEEQLLVDEEFPGDDSLEKVRKLLEMLSEPEELCGGSGGQDLVLDTEVEECLHWRRGALLYMYCHTVGEREGWTLRDPRAFHQCLQDGVHYLLKMLHTRSPVQLDDQVSFQDSSTAALLEKGIFSDIHVLALMYCGEMCYWALRHCRNLESPHKTESPAPNAEIHFRDIGQKVLNTYVGVCEGPLQGQGWSTDNAKKILQYLKEDVLWGAGNESSHLVYYRDTAI